MTERPTYAGRMFFWIGLAVVLVVFVGLVTTYQGRVHEPGTTHMRPPGDVR